jgi:transposase
MDRPPLAFGLDRGQDHSVIRSEAPLPTALLSPGARLRRQAFACGSPLCGFGLDRSMWPGQFAAVPPCPAAPPSLDCSEDKMMTASMKDNIATIGVDLGKNSFHLCAMNVKGEVVARERVTRAALPKRLANVPRCLIGMEACAGAHHVARQLAALGHDVRLIPAKYAKPFLKGHKNDYRDAEAIAEAVQRPTMRFVSLKSDEQLDLQALHRIRSRLVGQRTATINQIRGFLLEHGIPVRQGAAALRLALPSILGQRTDVLSPRIIRLVEDLAGDWRRLDERVADVTDEIEQLAEQDEGCKRMMTVPGVGPITATATVAAVGDGTAFVKGRDFAAWLGLVPKQLSTGDRTILGRLSRHGNRYLRTMFVQGARSILQHPNNWERYSFGRWLSAAAKRLHKNVLAAALANKLARIACSVLSHGRAYDLEFTVKTSS